MGKKFVRWAWTLAKALWLGVLVIAVAALAKNAMPEDWETLQSVAEAFMIAGAVEILFQMISIRRFLSEITSEIVQDALMLRDGLMDRLLDQDVRTIRRRCTERLIHGEIDEHSSLYDKLVQELDVMLARPWAKDTIINRNYVAHRLGAHYVWRTQHSLSFSWCNHLGKKISHMARLSVVMDMTDPLVEPLQDVEWTVAGKKIDPKRTLSADGKTVTYSWSGKVVILAGAEVKVVQKDVRILPIEDVFSYTPQSPHKGMVVSMTFDRDVFPQIRYLGWGARDDSSITPPSSRTCVLTATGWHLPEHVALVTWKRPGFTDPEKLALPSL